MAGHIAKTLIEHGKVERGWLGVSLQDLTSELAKSAGLKTTKGAYIADVVKGGPAAKAGIQKADLVTAIEGKPVADSAALRNTVASMAVGTEAAITVERKSEVHKIRVKIGSQEDSLKMMAASIKERLGADVRAVSEAEAQNTAWRRSRGLS